jgi:hypothetical protein
MNELLKLNPEAARNYLRREFRSLNKYKVGYSMNGDWPCRRCLAIANITIVMSKTYKEIETTTPKTRDEYLARMAKRWEWVAERFPSSPMLKFLRGLSEARSTLDKNHEKCFTCGLCMGEYHIASKVREVNGKPMCQWCLHDLKKQGKTRFMKRLRSEDANELRDTR